MLSNELDCGLLGGFASPRNLILQHLGDAFGKRGAGEHRVHRYARTRHALGQAARNRNIGGLADAVMDHLDRNVER